VIMSFQFIGSKISVISVHDLRFEGTLYTVDPKESTVALQNVTCFGTEDRRPNNVVPRSPDISEFYILRAEDIKDIVVLETAAPPASAAAPAPVPAAAPPAASSAPPAVSRSLVKYAF
jgi:protein LSM14